MRLDDWVADCMVPEDWMTEKFKLGTYGCAVDQTGVVAVLGAADQCKKPQRGTPTGKIGKMLREAREAYVTPVEDVNTLPLCEQHRARLAESEGIHASLQSDGRVVIQQIVQGELLAVGVLAQAGATH